MSQLLKKKTGRVPKPGLSGLWINPWTAKDFKTAITMYHEWSCPTNFCIMVPQENDCFNGGLMGFNQENGDFNGMYPAW